MDYRRHPSAGRRTRNKKDVLSAQERRRLAQLGASIALFLLVFAGRGLFPDQTAQWQAALRQDTDFRGAFVRLGEAVSRGERLTDTLGELWTAVFAGGTLPVSGPGPEWDRGPTFSQRVGEQLTQPQPILRSLEEQLPLPQEGGKDRARSAPAQTVRGGGEEPVSAPEQAPAPAASVSGAAAALSAVSGLPAAQTAQAQASDDQGRALPAAVSTVYYELGLRETVSPVSSAVTSDYGYRDHPVTGSFRFHRGVDLGATEGAAVAAFAGGTVAFTGRSDICGLYLQLDHGNGVSTFYCHCSALEAAEGQRVEAGQTVARVGHTGNATGPHLHFAVIKDGVYLDPLYYIDVGTG